MAEISNLLLCAISSHHILQAYYISRQKAGNHVTIWKGLERGRRVTVTLGLNIKNLLAWAGVVS